MATEPVEGSEGASSAELTASAEDAEDAAEESSPGAPKVRLPTRLTRAAILAPGTENESPSDPSPWHDPKGSK